MQCPFCDSVVEDVSQGVCSRCAVQANAQPAVESALFREAFEPSLLLSRGVAAVAIFAVLCSIGMARSFNSHSRPVFQDSGDTLVISDRAANSEVTFKVGQSETVRGHAMFFDDSRSSGNIVGYSFALGLLSEQDYEVMKRQYQSVGRCPSSFLNQRARTLALVVDDDNLDRRLAQLKVAEGAPVRLRGEFLEVKQIRYQGMPATFSGRQLDLFRVHDLTVGGD
jgi:hypothetical protein